MVPDHLTTLAPWLQVLSLLVSLHYFVYIFEWLHRLYEAIIVDLDIFEIRGTAFVV